MPFSSNIPSFLIKYWIPASSIPTKAFLICSSFELGFEFYDRCWRLAYLGQYHWFFSNNLRAIVFFIVRFDYFFLTIPPFIIASLQFIFSLILCFSISNWFSIGVSISFGKIYITDVHCAILKFIYFVTENRTIRTDTYTAGLTIILKL